MAQSDTTIDHDEIRSWAEERGGTPATVKGTGKKKDAGILRLDFEPKDEELEEISWDDFFEKFDKENLAFLYQEKTAKGEVSRFHKFVERETNAAKTSAGAKSSGKAKPADAVSKGRSGTSKTAAGRTSSSANSSSQKTDSEPKKRAGSKKS